MTTLAEEIVRLTDHYDVSFRRMASGDIRARLTEYDGHTYVVGCVSMVAMERAHVGVDGVLSRLLRRLERVIQNAQEDVK